VVPYQEVLKAVCLLFLDTWTAWVNGSNNAVINACDFIGMDAYPYYQTTLANSIENGNSTFYDAYDATLAAVGSKPVWVTETGWPVSGPTENLAVPSTQNAQTYWDQVGCSLFGKVNTWWYTVQDAAPTTPSPSFGIVGSSLTTTPLYNLQCPAISSASSSSAMTASSTTSVESASSSSVASGTASVVVGGGAGSTQTPVPGPLPAPSISSVSSATVVPPSSSSQNTASNVAPSSASSASDTVVPSSGTAPAFSAATPVQGSSTFATITKTSIVPSASPTSSGCPVDLSGQFEYPHLIVPIDKSQPDTAKGTSYNGSFSSTVSSIYNFDIPASDAGKTCSLVFLLPTQSQLTTSSFTLTGTGGMTVSRLQSPATQQTTYNTCPGVAKDSLLPRTIDSVTPGNEYVIASGSCFAGQTIAWEISATGSLSLDYFQKYGPAPIGLYVTVC
jgi:glucan endo-1,3-beta-D-glucosidase